MAGEEKNRGFIDDHAFAVTMPELRATWPHASPDDAVMDDFKGAGERRFFAEKAPPR
jgi:hypothetical protein